MPAAVLKTLLLRVPPREIPWDFVDIIETDQAGNVTLPSTPLVVRLDTTTPGSITPTLASFSDTGTFNNDTITGTTTPTFTGTATPCSRTAAS